MSTTPNIGSTIGVMSHMPTNQNHVIFQYIRGQVQQQLAKKAKKNVRNDLPSTIEQGGVEAERYLFVCILEILDLKELRAGANAKDQSRFQFLSGQLTTYAAKSAFLDWFPAVLETLNVVDNSAEYINEIFKVTKVSLPTQITVSLALALSNNKVLAQEGLGLLKTKLKEAHANGPKSLALPEGTFFKLLNYLQGTPQLSSDLGDEVVKFIKETAKSYADLHEFKLLIAKDDNKTTLFANEVSWNGTKETAANLRSLDETVSAAELLLELGPTLTTSIPQLNQFFADFRGRLDDNDVLDVFLMMANNSYTNHLQQQPVDENATMLPQKMLVASYIATKSNDWKKVIEEDQAAGGQNPAQAAPIGPPPGMEPKNKQGAQPQGQPLAWHVENVAKVIGEVYPVKWPEIIKALDRPGLSIRDQRAFVFLMKAFTRIRKIIPFEFPASVVLGTWHNKTSQAHFLGHLIQSGQPELVFFAELKRRSVNLDFNPATKQVVQSTPSNLFWTCLDLLEVLLDLSDSDSYLQIRELFEIPREKCPDLLILALAQCRPKGGGALLDELFSLLFPLYLMNHTNSLEILEQLFKVNPNLLIATITELYKKENSSMNLSRVLDITQEIKEMMLPIVNSKEYGFSVSLGILAGKRDFLHFEQWIADRIKNDGSPFIMALLRYIEETVVTLCKASGDKEQFAGILDRSQLTLESMATIFENLLKLAHETKQNQGGQQGTGPKLTAKTLNRIQATYKDICTLYPAICSMPQAPTDVETAANSYFEQVYKEEIPVSQFVELLRKLKSSSDKRELETFACMIHNLLDEYRFLNRYPPKELLLTGELYGAVIMAKLIDGPLLDLMFKFVQDALRKQGKIYDFGIKALEKFKAQLYQFPAQAAKILENEQIRSKNPEIIEEIIKSIEDRKLEPSIPNFDQLKKLPAGVPQPRQPQQPSPPPNLIQQQQATMPEVSAPQAIAAQPQKRTASPPGIAIKQTRSGSPHQVEKGPRQQGQMPPQMMMPGSASKPGPGGGMQGGIPYQFKEEMMMMGGGRIPPNVIMSGQSMLQPGPMIQMQKPPQMIPQMQPPMGMNPPQHPMQPTANLTGELDEEMRDAEMENYQVAEKIKTIITFAINNLSPSTLDAKCNEVKQHLEDGTVMKWFSKYLVSKRIMNEAQLHNIYLDFLNKLNKKSVWSNNLADTYANIHKLLNFSRRYANVLTNTPEKQPLKNLGTWLGRMTLARNKNIFQLDLDLKALLFEAFDNIIKIEVVLPFICKIMEAVDKSVVFKPPNPWVVSIFSLLNELKEKMDLPKLLRSEIAVLFTNLKVREEQFPPMNIIGERNKLRQQIMRMGQPAMHIQQPQPSRMMQKSPQRSQVPNTTSNIQMTAPGAGETLIEDLHRYIFLDTKNLKQFTNLNIDHARLVDIIDKALHRAIIEIIQPVIMRSITIALITTKEIALKDFALEPDAEKLRRAIIGMVQTLAGNLALVTCREPLKTSLSSHLKESIRQIENLDDVTRDQIVEMASLDNLDLGCGLIKQIVTKRAVENIDNDETINDALEKRRNYMKNGVLYTDEVTLNVLRSLPEKLRRPMGLPNEQLTIYGDLEPGRVMEKMPMATISPPPTMSPQPNMTTTPPPQGPPAQQPPQQVRSDRKINQNLPMILDRLEQMLLGVGMVADPYGQNEDLVNKKKEILKSLQEVFMSIRGFEETEKAVVSRFVTKYYSEENRGVYLSLLTTMKAYYVNAFAFSRDLIDAFLRQDDGKKMNYKLFVILAEKGLINYSEFDKAFAAQLEKHPTPDYFIFILNVLSKLVIDQSLATATQFSKCIEFLNRNRHNWTSGDSVLIVDLLVKLRQQALQNLSSISLADSEINLLLQLMRTTFSELDDGYTQTSVVFLEKWLRVSVEKDMMDYMKEFEAIIMKDQEKIRRFFICASDFCIRHAYDSAIHPAPGTNVACHNSLDFTYIDAFSKLIIICIKTVLHLNKSELLHIILESIVIVLTKKHEVMRENFNQRPFYKLFINLLNFFKELRSPDFFSESEVLSFLHVFASIFERIQPLHFPGFSFAWLELVSYKNFMPTLLTQSDSWENIYRLLKILFSFFRFVVDNKIFQKDAFTLYYNGTLRILLILLHDFPEFLATYAMPLCEELPQQFIQVRNVILSAFPKNVRPPHPISFSPKYLEVAEHTNTLDLPPFVSVLRERINNSNIFHDVNNYLATQNDELIPFIYRRFFGNDQESSDTVNIQMVNAFILCVPYWLYINNEGKSLPELKVETFVFLSKLIQFADFKGREAILSAMVNEARYPNRMSLYYISFFLHLLARPEPRFELIQEQLVRIILERLKIDEPYPWGVMYTYVELVRNPDLVVQQKPVFRQYDDIFESINKRIFSNNPVANENPSDSHPRE